MSSLSSESARPPNFVFAYSSSFTLDCLSPRLVLANFFASSDVMHTMGLREWWLQAGQGTRGRRAGYGCFLLSLAWANCDQHTRPAFLA